MYHFPYGLLIESMCRFIDGEENLLSENSTVAGYKVHFQPASIDEGDFSVKLQIVTDFLFQKSEVKIGDHGSSMSYIVAHLLKETHVPKLGVDHYEYDTPMCGLFIDDERIVITLKKRDNHGMHGMHMEISGEEFRIQLSGVKANCHYKAEVYGTAKTGRSGVIEKTFLERPLDEFDPAALWGLDIDLFKMDTTREPQEKKYFVPKTSDIPV